jgi:hypothetical protein
LGVYFLKLKMTPFGERGGGGGALLGKTLSAGLFVVVLLAAGCEHGPGNTVWLKDLTNPFIGQWQSDIPSADATIKFEYKTDGTFTCEFPAGPDTTMTATGGYLVKNNVQVTFLSYDGGIGGYTFAVADNDTINVTEIESVNEETGAITSGNTAPFIRVSGSAVNKENKPFELNNSLIGGTWKETSTEYKAEYQFKADGTGTLKFNQEPPFEIAYFAFHDEGLNKEVLVTFIPAMNAFTSYSYTINANSLTAQEITNVTMGDQGLSATYETGVTFTRSN